MPDHEPLSELSVAMITRDCADQVAAALASVASLAGRIVVLDTGSTDDTVARARTTERVEVLIRAGFEGFGAARREALEACRTPWVLFLDADERVDPELSAAIRARVRSGEAGPAGWRVRRRTWVLGHAMRSMGLDRDRPLRLVLRERARISDTLVHEVVEVDGPIGELGGFLEHDTFVSLDRYLRKIDQYTTLELEQRPRELRVWHLALVGPGTFLKWYLVRGGWRDGVAGLTWAGLTATGRFIRDMKVWVARQDQRPPASTDGP